MLNWLRNGMYAQTVNMSGRIGNEWDGRRMDEHDNPMQTMQEPINVTNKPRILCSMLQGTTD